MVTPLCKLALKYGTDKCPQLKHSYTPFYYQLLKDKRREIKKVLEMGIGFFPGMPEKKVFFDPGLKRTYHMGASLYMWRDFFPNAQVSFAMGRQYNLPYIFSSIHSRYHTPHKEDIVEL